jgi:hypothetical protein
MSRLVLAAALLLGIAAWGCTSSSLNTPLPDPPQFVGLPQVSEDARHVQDLHKVVLFFSWNTDRPSTDKLYFGANPDTFSDSLDAFNQTQPDASNRYGHFAPPGGHADLQFSSDSPVFYRIRAVGDNHESGFSQIYRYSYMPTGGAAAGAR